MSSLHANEAFLDHYQFSHDPFAARVPGFKFFPAQRKPVLGQLHHLARYSQSLLLVTGPLGSGKSLLRQALIASTNKQVVQSISVSARAGSDAEGVLAQVAQSLEIDAADLGRVQEALAALVARGQEVYLTVDDAAQLDDSALQVLARLADGDQLIRAHVFLFAEPSLIDRVSTLSGTAERFHLVELLPYEIQDTRDYLAMRLEGAGQGLDVLDDEQIADIHEQSGGWPGGINQVARDLLIDVMIAERSEEKPAAGFRLPRKHLLAAGVVLIALVAAWLMRSGGEESVVSEDSVARETSADSAPVAAPGQPLPLPLNTAEPLTREPLAEAAGPEEQDSGVGEMLAPPSSPVPAPGPAPAPAQAESTPPASQPSPVPEVSQPSPAQVTPAKPVDTPPKPPAVAGAAEPEAASASGAAGWYQAQAAGRFALQIVGTRTEASAQAFVAEHGADYRYFQKRFEGKPLYVVTYGSFATREEALQALKTLPAKVQAGKPWPRTFASIHQDISGNR